MNARLYDPMLGRFLSADPIIQDPYDTQSYNRYSYVRNNPLKYTDPSGHSWLSKIFKVLLAVVVAIVASYAVLTYLNVQGATYFSMLSNAKAAGDIGALIAAGFAGGFVSSGFAVSQKWGTVESRTIVMAMVGGTTSQITGGKFANGAISGAFVHLFNSENILKKLTFAKAREHYIENSGKQLSVDASSVDLSNVNSSIFKCIGDTKGVQLFFHGDEYSSFNDALTYGGITLVYIGGNQVGIMPDYYDFEMHDWGSDFIRNMGTIGGRILNMDPMGTASGYSINFVGTATIGGN